MALCGKPDMEINKKNGLLQKTVLLYKATDDIKYYLPLITSSHIRATMLEVLA